MKRKKEIILIKLLFISLILVILISCSKSTSSSNHKTIMPLSVGNAWNYECENYSIVTSKDETTFEKETTYEYWEIINTRIIEYEQEYIEVYCNQILQNYGFSETTLLGMNEDGLVEYGTLDENNEINLNHKLLIQYPISIGDIWEEKENGNQEQSYYATGEVIGNNDEYPNGEIHRYNRIDQYWTEDFFLSDPGNLYFDEDHFMLDDDNSQHFYEDIGKYDKYLFGWYDWHNIYATMNNSPDEANTNPIWNFDNGNWIGNDPINVSSEYYINNQSEYDAHNGKYSIFRAEYITLMNNAYQCITNNEEITTPAGTFICYVFEIVDDNSSDEIYTRYYYSPGVGLIGEKQSSGKNYKGYEIPIENRTIWKKKLISFILN